MVREGKLGEERGREPSVMKDLEGERCLSAIRGTLGCVSPTSVRSAHHDTVSGFLCQEQNGTDLQIWMLWDKTGPLYQDGEKSQILI